MAVCEILSVGTEILLGDILNTNCRFLSVELAKLGIIMLFSFMMERYRYRYGRTRPHRRRYHP